MKQTRNQSEAAMTVAEMAVAVGVLGLLGLVFFAVLNSGMVLYAKNTAVNVAHAEARDGINRFTRDLHASISVPQLRNTNFEVVTSTPNTGTGSVPMAAGVSFQLISMGAQYVWKDPGGSNKIMVKGTPDTPEAPKPGMRVIAPLFGVEENITKVTATPTNAHHHNVWFENGGEVVLANKSSLYGSSTSTYSIIYYTDRVMYLVRNGRYIPDPQGPLTLTAASAVAADQERFNLVNGQYVPATGGSFRITPAHYVSGSAQRYRYENGELRLYRQNYSGSAFYWEYIATISKFLSSPQPFYIPLTETATGPWYESTNSYAAYTTSNTQTTGRRFASSIDSRYVGIKLTSRDPDSSNRGYLSTATLLNTQIDYRSRIALYP